MNTYFPFAGTRTMYEVPKNFSLEQRGLFLDILEWVDETCLNENYDGRNVARHLDLSHLSFNDVWAVMQKAHSICYGVGVVLNTSCPERGKWIVSVVEPSPASIDFTPLVLPDFVPHSEAVPEEHTYQPAAAYG